jgi:hypothetical protein
MKNMRKVSVAALMVAAVMVMMSAGESSAAMRVGGKAGWARLRTVAPLSRRIGAGDAMARRAQDPLVAVRRVIGGLRIRLPLVDLMSRRAPAD